MSRPDADDTVLVNVNQGIRHAPTVLTLPELRALIMDIENGPREVIVDTVVDLTGNAALYKKVCTIPAGSVLQYVAAEITTLVVGGSTTVKLGIGLNAGDVDAYGSIAAFTVAGTCKGCFATVFAAASDVDVCGIVTNLSALGDTNLTAGKVRVVVVYSTPNVLT